MLKVHHKAVFEQNISCTSLLVLYSTHSGLLTLRQLRKIDPEDLREFFTRASVYLNFSYPGMSLGSPERRPPDSWSSRAAE